METLLKNGNRVTIRECQEDDAVAILDYARRISAETTYLSFGENGFDLTEEAERKILTKLAEADDQVMFIAFDGPDIVGFVALTGPNRERIRHVRTLGLTVRKSHWNLGLGTKLLELALDWTRSKPSIMKLDLQVRTDNQRAIDLYTRAGFNIEGTLKSQFKVGDTLYDHYCMGLVMT